jgi:hypothetical protein
MEAIQELTIIETPIEFPVAVDQIEKYRESYMSLSIAGIDDKEGYNRVHDARMIVKRSKTSVEKRRKELVEYSVAYQRKVNGQAKQLTALLEPIESHLYIQEKAYDDEVERIKLAAEMAAFARLEKRNASLRAIGMVFDEYGEGWHYQDQVITIEDVKGLPDEEFEPIRESIETMYRAWQQKIQQRVERLTGCGLQYDKAKDIYWRNDWGFAAQLLEVLPDSEFDFHAANYERLYAEEQQFLAAEKIRLEQEEQARKAEAARLQAQKAEQAEQQRLIDQQKAELKAQQDAIDAERRKLEEQQNADARKKEQAKRDAELKRQAAADALKKQQEQQERERRREARRIAAAPDKEKLEMLASGYESFNLKFDYNLPESVAIAGRFHKGIANIIADLRMEARELA